MGLATTAFNLARFDGQSLLNLLKQHQRRISTLLVIVLLSSSAWLLGKMVWMLLEPETEITPWRAGQVSASGDSSRSSIDLSDVHNAHWFGRYQADAAPVERQQPVVTDAPKTKLNLTLAGVVASTSANKSLAVIANRGQQATYGLDETIEGTRAKLKAVLVDRVIIENAGRDETLMLDGIDYTKRSQSPAANPVQSRQAAAPEPDSDRLEQIQQEISQDPQQLFQYVRMSQVKRDGDVVGYRLSPGKDRELFESIGLQNGDIATQLNGQDLTDPAAMGQIFQDIGNLTELSLTVERDGQPYDVYIQF
ncbi:type II secretion system protein GspC [Vibrio agarivorans]|uniref:type II secretion system protein GspC n=1 Tax=Vibrio agarivorans TaxID=153622 RepID=UPI003F517963